MVILFYKATQKYKAYKDNKMEDDIEKELNEKLLNKHDGRGTRVEIDF